MARFLWLTVYRIRGEIIDLKMSQKKIKTAKNVKTGQE